MRVATDHSPNWTYIFGLTFSCHAARTRVSVAMTHQQDSKGRILGATLRPARLIFCWRCCRRYPVRKQVPGFAPSEELPSTAHTHCYAQSLSPLRSTRRRRGAPCPTTTN